MKKSSEISWPLETACFHFDKSSWLLLAVQGLERRSFELKVPNFFLHFSPYRLWSKSYIGHMPLQKKRNCWKIAIFFCKISKHYMYLINEEYYGFAKFFMASKHLPLNWSDTYLRLVHVLLSRFYPDFILILSWVYPNFIQIKSG